MKFLKLTFLTTIVLAIAISVIYTSCERNVCDNVTCYNGGSCSGGTCLCPLGYEGPQCLTLSITRYLGVYLGYNTCNNNAEVYDTATIVADNAAINTVAITLSSLKSKILHGYVSSNQSTYSIIITNNDSLSTATTIYDRTFTATVQDDQTLSLVSYINIEDSTDSINSKCTFLGTKQ